MRELSSNLQCLSLLRHCVFEPPHVLDKFNGTLDAQPFGQHGRHGTVVHVRNGRQLARRVVDGFQQVDAQQDVRTTHFVIIVCFLIARSTNGPTHHQPTALPRPGVQQCRGHHGFGTERGLGPILDNFGMTRGGTDPTILTSQTPGVVGLDPLRVEEQIDHFGRAQGNDGSGLDKGRLAAIVSVFLGSTRPDLNVMLVIMISKFFPSNPFVGFVIFGETGAGLRQAIEFFGVVGILVSCEVVPNAQGYQGLGNGLEFSFFIARDLFDVGFNLNCRLLPLSKKGSSSKTSWRQGRCRSGGYHVDSSSRSPCSSPSFAAFYFSKGR